MLHPLILSLACLFATCCGRHVAAHGDVHNAHDVAAQIQPLIDPAKLATLGKRGANQRVEKITAILWTARRRRSGKACYTCLLGEIGEAKELLKRAVGMDGQFGNLRSPTGATAHQSGTLNPLISALIITTSLTCPQNPSKGGRSDTGGHPKIFYCLLHQCLRCRRGAGPGCT